jgi:hypothetical protein
MKAELTPLTDRGRARAVKDNGEPLMVIRPSNPTLALQLAKIAVEKNDKALFDRLPNEVGLDNYTIQGWLGPKGKLLDRDGNVIGECKPGDSFITMKDEPS